MPGTGLDIRCLAVNEGWKSMQLIFYGRRQNKYAKRIIYMHEILDGTKRKGQK